MLYSLIGSFQRQPLDQGRCFEAWREAPPTPLPQVGDRDSLSHIKRDKHRDKGRMKKKVDVNPRCRESCVGTAESNVLQHPQRRKPERQTPRDSQSSEICPVLGETGQRPRKHRPEGTVIHGYGRKEDSGIGKRTSLHT